MIFMRPDMVVLSNILDYIEAYISSRQVASKNIPDIVMQLDDSNLLLPHHKIDLAWGSANLFYIQSNTKTIRLVSQIILLLEIYAERMHTGNYFENEIHWNDENALMALLDLKGHIEKPHSNEKTEAETTAIVTCSYFDQFEVTSSAIISDRWKRKVLFHSKRSMKAHPVLLTGNSKAIEIFKDLGLFFFKDDEASSCRTRLELDEFMNILTK